MTEIVVTSCGAEAAEVVHALTQLAFAAYDVLDPPSGALKETPESVGAQLAVHGGMVATIDDEPVACARFSRRDGRFFVGRVAVRPDRQRQGIGEQFMAAIERHARDAGEPELRLGVRTALDGNRRFYERLGYREAADHGFWVELAKPLV